MNYTNPQAKVKELSPIRTPYQIHLAKEQRRLNVSFYKAIGKKN